MKIVMLLGILVLVICMKVKKNETYDADVDCIEIKETGRYINVFKEELDKIIGLLEKAKDIL